MKSLQQAIKENREREYAKKHQAALKRAEIIAKALEDWGTMCECGEQATELADPGNIPMCEACAEQYDDDNSQFGLGA